MSIILDRTLTHPWSCVLINTVCRLYCMLENRQRCKISFCDPRNVCGTRVLLCVRTVRNVPQLLSVFSPSLQIVLTEYQRKIIFQPVFSDICICTAYAHTNTSSIGLCSQLCVFESQVRAVVRRQWSEMHKGLIMKLTYGVSLPLCSSVSSRCLVHFLWCKSDAAFEGMLAGISGVVWFRLAIDEA